MKHTFLAFCLLIGVATGGLHAQTNITKTSVFAPNGIQVNTYTGALFHKRQDLFIPGRGLSIDVTFSYNSSARDRDWGYGRGWTHNYNMLYDTDSTNAVIIQQMDGRKNRFPSNGSGGYLRPSGVFDSLEQYQTGKLRLRTTDGTLYFFDNGTHRRITRMEDRNGNAMTFGYTDSLLTAITDPSGRSVQFTWTDGRMTKLTDPNLAPAREIVYEYDNLGEPRFVTDPLGNFMEYRYDDDYKMTAVINENGIPVNIEYNSLTAVRRLVTCVSTITISYNYELRRTYMVETVSGQDQITTYEYDAQGRLIRQFGNCCGYDVSYEYDANNNIAKRIDANGNATTYTYDVNGNVLQETDPLGNAETYTYEPVFNQLQSVTDRNSNTTAHVFDAKGNLLFRSRPLGIAEAFTYDAFGNPVTYTDARGHTTTYAYNANGYLTSITDPESGVTTLTYDGVGNNTGFTDPNNHTTAIEYDRKNREKKITNALGDFIEYTYDPVGNQTSFKDRNGHITTYAYDGVNRVVATVNPLGHTTTIAYDERGNVLAVKDANGHDTHFEYNTLNRLVKKTSPVGDATLYDYDGVGNLTTAVLPGGNVVQVVYDKLNRIAQISDELGLVAKYTYDKNSNRLSVADGNDNTTQYTYDAINRVATTRDPSGKIAQYTYDKNDNLTQVADRKGNVSVFTYDNLDRRITSKDPLNNITTFTYDPAGNLLTLKDAKNNTTTYTYDAVDRRVAETYPNGDQRAMAYDPVGNLVNRTEPNGYSIAYTYDDANRLLTRNYPNSVTETFAYDNVGQILSAVNPHSTVTMAYDAADRMVSETLNGRTTGYAYNTNARTRRITYPGGKQVLEQYDPRGRLVGVQDNTVSDDPLAAFEYDPGNRLLRKIFRNNAVSEYAYDLNSNTVQINHLLNSMVRYEYGYDNNDNKTYEKNNAQPTRSNQFLYDVYNRLTRFKKGTLAGNNIPTPSDDVLYNYDGVHNRQTVQVNGTTTTYTANNLNQYTMLAGGGTATLTYDANGNLLSDGTQTYAYDFENRLISVNGGATAKYFYDALGRRILKVAGADSTFYDYAQLRAIEERSATGGPVAASFVYGADLDEVLTMQRGGQTYYYHHNALGSVTHVTNTAGAIVEQYEYDAYGQVSFFSGAYAPLSASAIGNPVLFTGQRYDAESGLYFYKARYYSPVLGRFLQRDPLGFVDGVNLYAYVSNNPANYTDPQGLLSFRWYGNWGGPGWASGGWMNESDPNLPRNPGDPGYNPPRDQRDNCYYGHDTCLNGCTYICNPSDRSNCRVQCDYNLSSCLQRLPDDYTHNWRNGIEDFGAGLMAAGLWRGNPTLIKAGAVVSAVGAIARYTGVGRWAEQRLFGSGFNSNSGEYNPR
jgi:RHS repeat-associated protein